LGNFILRMRFQKGYFTYLGYCSKTPLPMRFRNVYPIGWPKSLNFRQNPCIKRRQ
jgi:hypothetical protein